MSNGNDLSTEELEALLGTGKESADLTVEESGVLTDVSSSSMKSAASALSTILNKQVSMSSPQVKTILPESLATDVKGKAIVVEVEYAGGINGPTYLVFLKEHGAIIADLMMGGNGTAPPQEINDLYLGALGEALGQMMDAAASTLSSTMGQNVTIGTPKIKVIDFSAGVPNEMAIMQESKIVKVSYNLTLGDLSEGKVIQLLPMQIANPIINSIVGPTNTPSPPPLQSPAQSFGQGVHPVQFSTLRPAAVDSVPTNMKILMDVSMDLSVEIGRKKLSIKEIIEIGAGTIVELDKIVGDPVDICVNNKLIAKGKVVVVDENFGVRVTEVLAPAELLETFK